MAYVRKERSATAAPLRFVNDLSKIPFLESLGLKIQYTIMCLFKLL